MLPPLGLLVCQLILYTSLPALDERWQVFLLTAVLSVAGAALIAAGWRWARAHSWRVCSVLIWLDTVIEGVLQGIMLPMRKGVWENLHCVIGFLLVYIFWLLLGGPDRAYAAPRAAAEETAPAPLTSPQVPA